MVRLNKFIADCGHASRRAADKLIQSGAVCVNGVPAASLGAKIDPQEDEVRINGVVISKPQKFTYIMLNKPKGCVTTAQDDCGRKTVFDYLGGIEERLFPVGRLDYDTEGLLILTNDGALCHKLTHPSQEVGKVYLVKVEGDVREDELAVLRKGVPLDGVKTAPCKIKRKVTEGGLPAFTVTVFEGRNRQIKRMFEYIGKNVAFLKRTAVGDLKLGGLGRGNYRELNNDEVEYLKKL